MNQKILIVPDLHGNVEACIEAIEKFVEEKYDKIIFLGDYTDSYTETNDHILEVVNLIIYLKERYGEQVILLLGNHDIQYMYYPRYRCSGFRGDLQSALTILFNENRDLFQIAHYEGDNDKNNHIFTHAGIQRKWWFKHLALLEQYRTKLQLMQKKDTAELLNYINESKDRDILHEVGTKRGGIAGNYGGITWCDKEEMQSYGPIIGANQYVGHTPVSFIEKIDKFEGDKHYNNTTITFTDCLKEGKKNKFATIQI